MSRKSLTLLIVAVALLGGCREEEPATEPLEPVLALDIGTVRIITETDTISVAVEIAEAEQERNVGLMRRTSLDENAGMIFIFPALQPADGAFWMFNTLIPLDIAFIGPDGRIGSIRQMEPCVSPVAQYCPNYAAGVPFQTALEVNAGFFAGHGVGPGAFVTLER